MAFRAVFLSGKFSLLRTVYKPKTVNIATPAHNQRQTNLSIPQPKIFLALNNQEQTLFRNSNLQKMLAKIFKKACPPAESSTHKQN
jgi:hypothetical protein